MCPEDYDILTSQIVAADAGRQSQCFLFAIGQARLHSALNLTIPQQRNL